MKKRIKIDSAILSSVIILTGFLYMFPGAYPQSRLFDNILDVFGLMTILKGTLLRMSARGHKMMHSNRSRALVQTGPYKYTRNPMYLGSFLLGVGFVLIVWPWWCLPIFALFFYLRFNKQMLIEEDILGVNFGKEYQSYCRQVPRLFPDLRKVRSLKVEELYNLKEGLKTKEKRGLFWWPVLAIFLETFQELIVFHSTDIRQTVIIFFCAGVVFLTVLMALHKQ